MKVCRVCRVCKAKIARVAQKKLNRLKGLIRLCRVCRVFSPYEQTTYVYNIYKFANSETCKKGLHTLHSCTKSYQSVVYSVQGKIVRVAHPAQGWCCV